MQISNNSCIIRCTFLEKSCYSLSFNHATINVIKQSMLFLQRKVRGISMSEIQNPILSGFHPDPSILRVGEDYYIATSTFEWFPGVQIHHSRDLVNW